MVETNELLVTRSEPGVAVVTLNRPQARNALSLSVLHQLHVAFKTLGADKQVAAIVLAANGPVFSSGHDLKEMTAHRADKDGGHAFFETTMRSCSEMMQAVVHCPRPVIAAVSGVATAAGCQLVASCDLAVAAESATFATPGVNIGLFCSTPMVALSRNVPRKKAMEMLLLGEAMSADDAVQYGLVNRAVAPGDVLAEALAMARKIASKSKATIAIGKSAFYRQIEAPLGEAYLYAARIMVENMMAADAEEGICAFIEKRPPQWTGG
ncbi:MAG TPA: enoyl-CoA hydratase [Hyphomicrobium sp.]|nr:enoyl-CoA hydratase [Hyphomicrobium sp.]